MLLLGNKTEDRGARSIYRGVDTRCHCDVIALRHLNEIGLCQTNASGVTARVINNST